MSLVKVWLRNNKYIIDGPDLFTFAAKNGDIRVGSDTRISIKINNIKKFAKNKPTCLRSSSLVKT